MKTLFTFLVALMSLSPFAQRFDWVSFTPLTTGNGNGGSGGLSVTTDNEGNIYNVTVFNDPIVVGSDTLTHVGNFNRPDILLTKWNAAGEVLAYRHFANWSNNGNPDPQQLLFDEENGEVLLTISSYYNGMQVTLLSNGSEADTLLSLAPGAVLRFSTGLDFISKKNIPGGTSYGTAAAVKDSCLYAAHGYNSTISKTDTAGTVLWSKTPTGTMYSIFDLAVAEDDFVYVIGHYHSNQLSHNGVTLGGITIMPPSAGNNSHVIIFKLDTDGNVLQGHYLAEAQFSLPPIRITTDSDGNVFAAIPYAIGGQVIGTHTLGNPTGANDGFVVKLNSNLEPQWVTEVHHTGGNMEMRDIVVHPSGKVMAIGLYGSNATIGGFPLAFAQYGSGYLTQMDNVTGNILYATNLGSRSAGSGHPNSITNIGDKYYIGGECSGNYGFPQWTASFGCYTQSRTRTYLTCFNDIPFESPTVELVYGSVSLMATTNVEGATFQWFLNGEELEGETGSSITPTQTGNYEVVISYYGCTASDTYTLSCIPTTGTDIITACESHTWIDGITYTSNNFSATYSLTSSLGCDSLVTLNLTVTHINSSFEVNGNTLTANSESGSYQWYDCSNKLDLLEGETNHTFSPAQSGTYALQVTEGNCSDISDCIEVTIVSVDELDGHSFSIYPNPAKNFITLSSLPYNSTLRILNTDGALIYTSTIAESSLIIDISDFANGVYFIEVSHSAMISTKKKFIIIN